MMERGGGRRRRCGGEGRLLRRARTRGHNFARLGEDTHGVAASQRTGCVSEVTDTDRQTDGCRGQVQNTTNPRRASGTPAPSWSAASPTWSARRARRSPRETRAVSQLCSLSDAHTGQAWAVGTFQQPRRAPQPQPTEPQAANVAEVTSVTRLPWWGKSKAPKTRSCRAANRTEHANADAARGRKASRAECASGAPMSETEGGWEGGRGGVSPRRAKI